MISKHCRSDNQPASEFLEPVERHVTRCFVQPDPTEVYDKALHDAIWEDMIGGEGVVELYGPFPDEALDA